MLAKISFRLMLLISTLFSGCYSFYSVGVNVLRDLKEEENIEINLKDDENIFFYNVIRTEFVDSNKIEIIRTDSSKSTFSINEIKGVAIERFDFMKTFLTSIFIIILLVLTIGIGSPGG